MADQEAEAPAEVPAPAEQTPHQVMGDTTFTKAPPGAYIVESENTKCNDSCMEGVRRGFALGDRNRGFNRAFRAG